MNKPVPFGSVRLILFDLDGTLVDSVGDLAWCGNEMRRRLGLPPQNPDAARIWVGNGVERFVKRFLTGEMEAEPAEDLYQSGLAIFEALYADNVSTRSRVFPGVKPALERLARKNLHLACVTNKPHGPAVALLEAKAVLQHMTRSWR